MMNAKLRSVVALLAIGLVLAGGASAQEAADEARNLFLWEVEGEQSTVYLLGSIHLAQEDLYPLDAKIDEAYDAADTLVVEVDIDESEQHLLGMKMLTAGMYLDGRNLDTELDVETRERLQAFLEERGLPYERFKVMQPWLVSMMLTLTEMQRLGYDAEMGIDQHFIERAREEEKPIEALETADFQINLFADFPEELQEKFLAYTLEDVSRIPEVVDEMMRAWKTGDEAGIENILLDPAAGDRAEYEDIYEKVIYDRNDAMTAEVEAMLEDGGTWFVVVGAGHLVGERGIVNLLRDKGHSVEQAAAAEKVRL